MRGGLVELALLRGFANSLSTPWPSKPAPGATPSIKEALAELKSCGFVLYDMGDSRAARQTMP